MTFQNQATIVSAGFRSLDDVFEQLARIPKAVADPARLELLDLLAQGERSVDQLARVTANGMTRVSVQLQELRRVDSVAVRRRAGGLASTTASPSEHLAADIVEEHLGEGTRRPGGPRPLELTRGLHHA